MAAKLQQAVDAGELCIGLDQKISMLFASNLISYTPIAVSTRVNNTLKSPIYIRISRNFHRQLSDYLTNCSL